MKKNIDTIFNLKGKVAIITGGAGMLGAEYTRVLGEAGATVVIFDILKASAMKAHARALQKETNSSVIGVSVDVTDEKKVNNAVNFVIKNLGKVDILINNAALTDFSKEGDRFSPYEKFSLELWKKEIDVCLTGAFICAKAVLPHMMKRKSGVIVNISSTYGVVAPDNRIYKKGKYRSPAYVASKSGIINFTRALASYSASYGIRVNTFTPGGVFASHDKRFFRKYSERTMMGRMARKEEYRGPILFLCSDASSYMTGANLIVDGGWTAW